jgi:hypothetical protein
MAGIGKAASIIAIVQIQTAKLCHGYLSEVTHGKTSNGYTGKFQLFRVLENAPEMAEGSKSARLPHGKFSPSISRAMCYQS